MTVERRTELNTADMEAMFEFLQKVQAGNDPNRASLAAARKLSEGGAPSHLSRNIAQMAFVTSLRKRMESCTDERKLALFRAQLALAEADAPPEEIFPLVDLYNELCGKKGRKRRKLGFRTALSIFAAAVTVLKKEHSVDEVIAEIATPNGINRKELKNFRDRLNRGLASQGEVAAYHHALCCVQSMTRSEIKEFLARTVERFCT